MTDTSTQRKKYEANFARSFLIPEERERFIRVTANRKLPPKPNQNSTKRRAKFRTMLSGLKYLLARDNESIKHYPAVPGAKLLKQLLDLGAPRVCYVLSLSPNWDGQFRSLEKFVPELSEESTGTSLIICIPESLAFYYHGEISDLSTILYRTKYPKNKG